MTTSQLKQLIVNGEAERQQLKADLVEAQQRIEALLQDHRNIIERTRSFALEVSVVKDLVRNNMFGEQQAQMLADEATDFLHEVYKSAFRDTPEQE